MTAHDHGLHVPAQRTLEFVHRLRAQGFALGIDHSLLAVDMVCSGIGVPKAQLHQGLKCLLCSNTLQWQAFDSLFEQFWGPTAEAVAHGAIAENSAEVNAAEAPRHGGARGGSLPSDDEASLIPRSCAMRWLNAAATPQSAASDSAADDSAADALEVLGSHRDVPQSTAAEEPGPGQTDTPTERCVRGFAAVDTTRLAHTDLRELADDAEIREAQRQARLIALAMRTRLSRRYRRQYHQGRPDLRQTLRLSLGTGGELTRPVFRARRLRAVRILVFVDVSGSMQHYSRFFLQFVKGLVNQWIDSDVYLFHTHLVRATCALRERDNLRAMQRLAALTNGIGGGTNLTRSLRQFNRRYSHAHAGTRTVAFILGDGYDSGEAHELSLQLKLLKRRVKHLVWLNPLLGWPNYRPSNGTMRAALPHLDLFAPANTLASLSRIEPLLAGL